MPNLSQLHSVKRSARAFTLFECLVASGIVIALLATLLAVYGQGNERGHYATEISDMHQLA